MIQATPIGGESLRHAVAGRFPDLVTIKAPTATVNDCNEPVDAYTDLAEHVDLPAFVAPGDVYAKMKRQETMASGSTTEFEYRRVLLNGCYPLILLTHHAEIEGFEWDIVAIDFEPTETFTQLLIQRVDPGSL